MESLPTQNGKFLEGCLQFGQQRDGHPQSALLFLCKISFSHQEIIQRNIKECCKLYGQLDWAIFAMYGVLTFIFSANCSCVSPRFFRKLLILEP